MLSTFGIRAHDFGKMESRQLAEVVRQNGLGSVQLALAKAIKGINDPGEEISLKDIAQIGQDFEDNKVSISVLGCYLNYAHPDEESRLKNMDIFKKHIDYMPFLKGRVVGTETGSLNGDYSWNSNNHSDEAYLRFARSLEVLLDYAHQKQVQIAIEGVYNHIIYSNEQMLRLIKDMKSDYLKVILDPVNLLNSANHHKKYEIMEEAFELFGDKIAVVHVKDYELEKDKIIEINHGKGLVDYYHFMKPIHNSNEPIDVLLENADVNNLEIIKKLMMR